MAKSSSGNRADGWKNLSKVVAPPPSNLFPEYQDNLAGFITDQLNEELHPKLREVIDSVMHYPVTLVPSSTGFGKSWLASKLAIAFFKVFQESQTHVIAAPPRENLTRNIWAHIRTAVIQHPLLFSDDRMVALSISRNNRPLEIITGRIIPKDADADQLESKFSGVHAKYILVIMDEGDAIPEPIYTAIEGWSSGGMFRQLILYNPKKQVGPVYRMYESGTANVVHLSAFDHPNVITGKDLFPGAVTRDKIVKRISEQCYLWNEVDPIKPEDTVFDLPDFLVGCSAKSNKGIPYTPLGKGKYVVKREHSDFVYKVLALYPSTGLNVSIPPGWIDAAMTRWNDYTQQNIERGLPEDDPPALARCMMGGDVADDGIDINVLCRRYDRFVQSFRKLNALGITETALWLTNEYKEQPPYLMVIDTNGVGAGVPGVLAGNGCSRVCGVKFQQNSIAVENGSFGNMRDQLFWAVRNYLDPEGGCGAIPNDDNLRKQLLALRHQEIGGTIKFISKQEMRKSLNGASTNELDALALTFFEGTTHIGGIKKNNGSN